MTDDFLWQARLRGQRLMAREPAWRLNAHRSFPMTDGINRGVQFGWRKRKRCAAFNFGSALVPLHETIDHPFLAGFIEVDDEFVAVNLSDPAVAKLHMKDAFADLEIGAACGA